MSWGGQGGQGEGQWNQGQGGQGEGQWNQGQQGNWNEGSGQQWGGQQGQQQYGQQQYGQQQYGQQQGQQQYGQQQGQQQNQVQQSNNFQNGKEYKISSTLAHGKNLDCSQSDNAEQKNTIIVWDSHNDPNQKFKFEPAQNGAYYIYCSINNGCLEVPDVSNHAGTQARVNLQPKKSINQLWYVMPTGEPNVFNILSSWNHHYLEVQGSGNGSKVVISAMNQNTPAQKWLIK